MKRLALQNEQVGVLRMDFRARKVFGTFEKRAPGADGLFLESPKNFSGPKSQLSNFNLLGLKS